MENISMRMDGRKLIVEVDLDAEVGPSKSGKSTLIATTGGEKVTLGPLLDVPADDENVVVTANIYRPR